MSGKLASICCGLLGASVLSLSACSAPMGPIGGIGFSRWLDHCHLCGHSSICDEDDPTIVPPHASFHPLPTRPVFSPPAEIPGVYAPWPGGSTPQLQPVPPNSALEVQNQASPGFGPYGYGQSPAYTAAANNFSGPAFADSISDDPCLRR